MDTRPYIDLIIDKINQNNGYSEIDEKDLRLILQKDLDGLYKKELEKLCVRIEMASGGDLISDTGTYNKEQINIKSKVLKRAQALAKASKD